MWPDVSHERPRQRRFRRRLKARWRLIQRGPLALPVLFAGAVLESSILPWPIEFPMLAYMLRGRIETLAATVVVTLGSVIGCILIYALGLAAYDLLSGFIEARPSLSSALTLAQVRIDEVGAWAVGLAMVGPTPVQLASLAAGMTQMNLAVFVLAVFAGRSIRYWSIGLLVLVLGPSIMTLWRRLPRQLRYAVLALLVIVFAALFALTIIEMLEPRF